MQREEYTDLSIACSFFYLKCVGFWSTKSGIDEYLRRCVMIYTGFNIAFAYVIEVMDIYYSWGNFEECIYIGCNICTLTMVTLKLSISIMYRNELLRLITYAKKMLWHYPLDPIEQAFIGPCRSTCIYIVSIFSGSAVATVAGYVLRPIIADIGRNGTDRSLPLRVWLDLPVSVTPYYETMFVVQVLTVCHAGLCYLCFDILLMIINLHVASQFRILQYRLTEVCPTNVKEKHHKTDEYYAMLKRYIKQHQALIAFCNKHEKVFSLMVFVQVLLFSLLICLVGYLVLMDDVPTMIRINFVFYLFGGICQLLMYTYSCDCLIRESVNVANAAYESLWFTLPMDESGRFMRKDLVIIIMRAKTPCRLTACGFSTVSLETYTKVLSTAVTYFTLLSSC